METTFITIQDLTPEARILYTSDSIVDILGYSPDEVVNRSCWDFFHPDELPYAQAKHGRGIEMDKAAVLSYCRMKGKDGSWLGCEVVFTVVYDVLVGCTSIYRRGLKSQSRAIEAPAVRRLFSNSPRDPRYHMLSHLSSKFYAPPPKVGLHEPRAALFVNRYTRTLTIMYATDGLSDVLGISGEELRGRSFYYCIQEDCLQDAVRCLESAKANDSIAYLRFCYRDPRIDDEPTQDSQDITDEDDTVMFEEGGSSAEDDESMDIDAHQAKSIGSEPVSSTESVNVVPQTIAQRVAASHIDSRTSSGESSNSFSHEAVFGSEANRKSSASSVSNIPKLPGSRPMRAPLELEAIVSCTSDGLVVCLRKAAPIALPLAQLRVTQQGAAARVGFSNDLFAAPWSPHPILPADQDQPRYTQNTAFAPGLASAQAHHTPTQKQNADSRDFMSSIRDCAVFAWALTGINGSLAEYSRGKPRGESQPASGLPIWQPGLRQEQDTTERDAPVYSLSASPSSTSRSPADSNGSYRYDGGSGRSNSIGYSSNTSNSSAELKRPKLGVGSGKGSKFTNVVDGEQYSRIEPFANTKDRTSLSRPSHTVDGMNAVFPHGDYNHATRWERNARIGSGHGFGDPGLSPSTSKTNVHPAYHLASDGDTGRKLGGDYGAAAAGSSEVVSGDGAGSAHRYDHDDEARTI